MAFGSPCPPPQNDRSPMKYDVVITGDVAPFKWEVRAGTTSAPLMGNDDDGKSQYARGAADTFAEAVADARDAALTAERFRHYNGTKTTVQLLDIDAEGNITDLTMNAAPVPPLPQSTEHCPDAIPDWMCRGNDEA